MRRVDQHIDHGWIRFQRERAARACQKTPRPGADPTLAPDSAAISSGVDWSPKRIASHVPENGRVPGNLCHDIGNLDPEFFLLSSVATAATSHSSMCFRRGSASRTNSRLAAGPATHEVKIGLVISMHECIVAAWRDTIRAGEHLLHENTVDAGLRPGLHHFLCSQQLPLQQVLKQFRLLALDTISPLKPSTP